VGNRRTKTIEQAMVKKGRRKGGLRHGRGTVVTGAERRSNLFLKEGEAVGLLERRDGV